EPQTPVRGRLPTCRAGSPGGPEACPARSDARPDTGEGCTMNRSDHFRRFTLAAAVLLITAAVAPPASAQPKADDPALKAASALYDGIRVETLDNGLRVYLKPVPGSGTVTTMVAYKVGSADEELDSTGLSHYLEHLMFKGTDKIKPGDI